MTAVAAGTLPSSLAGFPGVILQLDAEGVVRSSNGRLDAEVSAPVTGRSFAALVDADSSRAKWLRTLAEARATHGTVSAELILARDGELGDPRPFSLVNEPDAGSLWLIEHPRDERLDRLRDEVTGINSELAAAQRELVKEQRRLRQALAEQERLGAELRAQNARIEAQRAELARSNRALDEFAHAVSHDLKAPLRAIGSYGAWIREDLPPDAGDALRDHTQRLDEQVRRMRALIDGAIAYARAGRAEAGSEPVDLGELAREIVALLAPPSTADVRILPLPVIRSARAPLRQVLQNLVDNAIKHAGGKPVRVTIDARDAGDFVALRVRDDGPGIPAEQHERIWGLFNTLEPSSAAVDSTGIGLALVRRLAEAHGGSVAVDSAAGEGATFTVRWPKSSDESEHDD